MDDRNFALYRAVGKQRQENRERQYELDSGNRLAKILAKKFDTANIGSIASIEDHIGHLWGHGKPDAEKSQVEREWTEKWMQLRKEILDKGNHQRRASMEELNQYTVVWNRYRKTLPVRENNV